MPKYHLKTKKRILVVDNEVETVNLFKEILQNEGYDVVTALSGKECLKILQKETFDLILLDIMMPENSGWDVYEKIRKTDKDIKVAFVSILEVSQGRLEQLKKEGISDYINKPFTRQELVNRVNAIFK